MKIKWLGSLRRASIAACAWICIAGACSVSQGATWKIEAEKAGDGNVNKTIPGAPLRPTWKVTPATNASSGAYLNGALYSSGETHPIPVRIPHAGKYRVWVRHNQTAGKASCFFVLFRDDSGIAAGVERVDWHPKLMTEHPYEKTPEAPKDAKAAFVWSSYGAIFERAMPATVCFGAAIGTDAAVPGIDCLVMTDDPAFDPQKTEWTHLPAEAGASEPQKIPAGMKPALPFTLHSSFFSGSTDPNHQFKLGLLNANSLYIDSAWTIQLGANYDHGWNGGSAAYGIRAMAEPEIGYFDPEFVKAHPSPQGRFVNADGQVGRSFSYSYEPYREAVGREIAKGVLTFKDDETIQAFRIADEDGGRMDYSDSARDRFHKWLEARYGDIAKLNEPWRTNYESFAAVALPKNADENKAAWFAFHEFSGLELVTLDAEKAKVITQTDPKHRPCDSQASGLSILSVAFTTGGPLNYEDLINVAFAGQPAFGWDAYSVEDSFIGSDADFLLSLANGREVSDNEWNVHSQDARLAARSYWTMIGKGLKGVACYMLQENLYHWQAPWWGLMNFDFTPREKLAAIADASHEVHHLERLLMPAKPTPFVKPVAFYYSRMDLSLPQPMFDVYGCPIDSPYRVYGVLRGLGYPVRWVTPRLIEAGALKDVGAVVMLNIKYVPEKTANALAEWVKQGGCIMGDEWPGIFDEYGRAQKTFVDVFGVRSADAPKPLTGNAKEAAILGSPNSKAQKDARLKFQETSTTFYGVEPDVLRAMNSDEISKSVDEMYEQWDSTHPVAKAVGHWHLSGYDLKRIECASGHVVGMAPGGPGHAAMVINDYGKGHALYSAMMLGTLYDAGPIRYEWDSSHEGTSLARLLDAYLRFCGVEPFAVPKVPIRVAQKMRIEMPLVDAKKNVIVGLASLNDLPLSPFSLSLQWPSSAPQPRLALITTGGTRRMEQVPFEIKDGQLTLTMPGFDTHATLLALTDSDPLISLAIEGASRGGAGLLEATPNARMKIKATIWNPSPRKLTAGAVRLYAAPGWFSDAGEIKIGPIAPYASREASFEVAAPSICAARTLRPIVVKYESGKMTSSPSTEMVWWQP